MSNLNEQCARLDGACVHDFSEIDYRSSESYVCIHCKKRTTYKGSKITTDLNYCGSIDTAVKFARRMDLYLVTKRWRDCVKVYRESRSLCTQQEYTEYYKNHNDDEIVTEATAICTAVIDMKEKA